MLNEMEYRQRYARVDGMPSGKAKVLAAELLVREVEQADLKFQLPEALMLLIEAHTFGDRSPQVFAVFSKLLRLFDEHPEYFDEWDQDTLFWQFKWMADDMRCFPQISQAQARGLLDDMRRRYQLDGRSMAAVERAEYKWALSMFDDEAATQHRSAWLAFGEDELDCAACQKTDSLEWHIRRGELAEAIAIGPVTEGGCNREPAGSYMAMAEAHMQKGDIAEALMYLKMFEASNQGEEGSSDVTSGLVRAYALLGQFDRAMQILRRDGNSGLVQKSDPRSQMGFALDLVEALSANQHLLDQPLKLKVASNGHELLAWAIAAAEPLARAFDERAGNTGCQDRLAKARLATRYANLDTEPLEDSAEESAPVESLFAQKVAPLPPSEVLEGVELAEKLLEDGDLAGAGLAFAEVAHESQEAVRFEEAGDYYLRALPLLVSGEADASLRLAVLIQFVDVALELDNHAQALQFVDEFEDEDTAELMGDLQQEREAQRAFRQAKLQELRATIALNQDVTADSAALAQQTAEAFGFCGAISESIFWFKKAGKYSLDIDRLQDAAWNLESAIEGMNLLGHQRGIQETLSELTDVLEQLGQTDRAQQLIAQYLG